MARYLTIEDGREYLWDFDENRILLVTYGDTENIRQVEFSTDDTEGPTTWTSEVMTNLTTGNKYVQVPNEFLNGEYSRLVCYVIAEDETGQHTRTKEIFRIKKRQQPEDYEITFTDRVYIRDLKAIAERYRDQAKEYSEQAAASSTQAGQYNAQALASKNAAAESERNAESSMVSAQSAQHAAESARNDANAILTLVQSKGTEITNFVATSKTEIETQKNESVNAVKSVYQTDLNELKGDLGENVILSADLTWEDGYYIKYENGVFGSSGSYSYADNIDVTGYTSIALKTSVFNDVSGYAFYDANGAYITGANTYATAEQVAIISVPSNATTLRFTCKTQYKENVYVGFLDLYGKTLNIESDLFEATRTEPTLTWNTGEYVRYSNGTIGSASAYSTTDMIEVHPYTSLILQTKMNNDDSGIAFYDEDNVFISGSNISSKNELPCEYAIPSNAKYFRFTTLNYYKPKVKFVLIGASKALATLAQSMKEPKGNVLDVTWNDGYVINYDSGYMGQVTAYSATDYIDVFPYSKIDVASNTGNDSSGIAFYDECYRYISGLSLYPYNGSMAVLTIPSGAKYARYSCLVANKSASYIKPHTTLSTNEILALQSKINDVRETHIKDLLYSSVNMFESIAGIGDSYTEGTIYGETTGVGSYPDLAWIAVMGKRSGVQYKNYGKGGATTASYIVDKLPTVLSEPACGLYFLALGQNDLSADAELGSIDDIHEDYTQNPNTFYGNYGKIIAQIMEHAPNAKLVLIASWIISSTHGHTYQIWDDDIKAIGDHFGIPTIFPYDDDFFNSPLYLASMKSGHPTLMGHTGMGIAMERLFSKCVVNNPSYFKFTF